MTDAQTSLAEACAEAREKRRLMEMDPDDAHIVIVVNRKREPRGEIVRLVGGLSGKFVGSSPNLLGGVRVVVDVKVTDVESWLARNA